MKPCGPESMYCNHKVEPSQMSAHFIKDKLIVYLYISGSKQTNYIQQCG